MAVLQRRDQAWLDQVREGVVDPERDIVDPHHHLWRRESWPYHLDELLADTDDGHRVTQTVFVECGSAYHQSGPDHLVPVGETAYVASAAAVTARGRGATIAGIVAHADLTMADDLIGEVLDAHADVGGSLFKGIRHSGARDQDPGALTIVGRGAEGQYSDPQFRQGVAELGRRGLTYDTWHYHHQNLEFASLAAAVPDTQMVLDHFGTPLGVGRFAGRPDEVFAQWKAGIAAVAQNDNVVAKLGGLAMPDNGFGFHERDRPPTSDEFVEAQAAYYLHTIELFGPDRCMFESNFPVDRMSLSYHVFWNGVKKMVSEFSESEKDAMFSGTARRVYRL